MSGMSPKYLIFTTEAASPASVLFKGAAQLKDKKMSEASVDEQRRMHASLHTKRPLPPGIEVLPARLADVPCEWVLRPQNYSEKIIVYLHGGGWILGSLDTARPVAGILADQTPYKVLAVDYRLAPEHPYPAALDDCHAVYVALLAQNYKPQNIALFGDSAGGNLALCLMHRLREEGLPLPLVFAGASPVTDMTETSEIVRVGPDLTKVMYQGTQVSVFSMYLGSERRMSPFVSPVMGDMGEFPPMLIHVGGDEPLVLDCAAFAKKATRDGATVCTKIWRHMYHDFTIVGSAFKESRESMQEICDFIERHLGHGAGHSARLRK